MWVILGIREPGEKVAKAVQNPWILLNQIFLLIKTPADLQNLTAITFRPFKLSIIHLRHCFYKDTAYSR